MWDGLYPRSSRRRVAERLIHIFETKTGCRTDLDISVQRVLAMELRGRAKCTEDQQTEVNETVCALNRLQSQKMIMFVTKLTKGKPGGI